MRRYNLVQHGVGGSWDDRSVGGFGWGTGSALMCRYTAAGNAATAAAAGESLTHTSSGDAPAHVVSSALAVCEAPVLADPVLERGSADDAAAAASVAGLIVLARVTSCGGQVSANASAIALR